MRPVKAARDKSPSRYPRRLYVTSLTTTVAQGHAAFAGTCGFWRIGPQQATARECGIVLFRIAPQSPKEIAGSLSLPSNINQAGGDTSALSPANRSACAAHKPARIL